MGRVGRVEIDDVVRSLARRRGGDREARVAVGIKKAEARAGLHVGAHEVEEQSGLAGTCLPDDVNMPPAIGGEDRHELA